MPKPYQYLVTVKMANDDDDDLPMIIRGRYIGHMEAVPTYIAETVKEAAGHHLVETLVKPVYKD